MKPKPKNTLIGSMKRMPITRAKRTPTATAKKMGAEGPKKKAPVPTIIKKEFVRGPNNSQKTAGKRYSAMAKKKK